MISALAKGILGGDRHALSKAITMAESTLKADRQCMSALLEELAQQHQRPPKTVRIGMTGSPGVGKSTLIEALGTYLTENEKLAVAVLAVDPSSTRSGGSILGDKTRMSKLSNDPRAFVRPSPTRGDLGGVAAATFDSVRLCEFAGYDCIIIETVGVGQSELLVADLVDCFVLLVAPGAGDELQGLKRGITELADLVLINKFDQEGQLTLFEYKSALKYQIPPYPFSYSRSVLPVSGKTGFGIQEAWEKGIKKFCDDMEQKNWFCERRRIQQEKWIHSLSKRLLQEQFEEFLDKPFQQKETGKSIYAQAEEIVHSFLKSQ